MSTTVDNRVVEMQFDNKHFESNVRTSMSTLDKLKQSLNLKGAAKSFDSINTSVKKVDMNPLGKAVETVGLKFNAMYTIADQALRNITNSAMNAGKRIVSALTIDPVKTGFSEYETKIGSIQTIMSNTASKGTTMDDVTRVIDELNTYADKTIYNFAEMTRNIGTFTAAGVGLEESAAAIQGIANLAASSGSTSQQASTAMYQLSQALAAGTVKLMDWNSVVNAGMGGEKFQEALKATARDHGIAVDDLIKKNGSFRESLQEGWISADILNETLNKFTVEGAKNYAESMKASGKWTEEQANALIKEAQAMEDAATKVKTFTQLWDTLKESAQSGWGKTWELLVGDFEEAKELWTSVSDVLGGIINNSADARNNMLEGALTSNWDKMIQQINEAGIQTSAFEEKVRKIAKDKGYNVDALIKNYGSLAKAFQSGAISADILKQAIKGLGTSKFDLSGITKNIKKGARGDDVKKIQTALKELGYDLGKYGVDGKFGKLTEGAVKAFQELKGLKVTGIVDKETLKALEEANTKAIKLGDNITDLIDGVTKLGGREKLINAFRNLFSGIGKIIKPVKNAFSDIFPPTTSEQLYNLIDGFEKLTQKFNTFLSSDKGKDVLGNLASTFKGVFSIIKIGATTIASFAKGIAKVVIGLGTGLGGGILEFTGKIGDWITKLNNWIEKTGLISAAVEGVTIALQNGIKLIGQFGSFLKDKLLSVFGSDSSIGDYFSEGINKIKEFLKRVKQIESFDVETLGSVFKDFRDNVVDYFLNIDINDAVDKMTNGLKKFKDSAKEHLDAAGEKFSTVKEKLIAFANFIKSKLPAAIAIGMGVLLIKSLSKLGKAFSILANPLEGLQEMLGGVAESFAKLNKAKAFEARTKGIKNLAISLAILAGSIALLTMLDQDKLKSAMIALGGLTVMLIALSLVSGKMAGLTNLGKVALPMLALSASLLILVECLKSMENLGGDNLLRNVLVLGAMAVALAGIVGVLGKLSPNLTKSSFTFMAIAAGLKIMVGTLSDLDSMKFSNLGRSIGIMIGIVAGLSALALSTKGISFGSMAGIVAIAIGLKLLVGTIDKIANLDTSKIKSNIESFIVIFGALTVLMIASKFAGKYAASAGVGILAMSVAMLFIVRAMKSISELDHGTVSKSVKAISQLLIVFGMVTALSTFAGKRGASAAFAMVGMSAALIILTGVIVILKDINPSGLDKAIDAIRKVVLIFSILVAATHFATGSVGTIIAITVAASVLAAAVAGLSFIDPSRLTNAVTAVSTIVGMLTLLVASTKFATGSMGTLIVMTVAVGLLAGIVYLLSGIPVESAIGIAASLSTLILSLSASCKLLSMVPITGALTGVASLAIFIAGLGLIMAAISGLNSLMPGMNDFIANGIPTLELLGKGLGSFFGGIAGGFAEGLTSSLGQIGTDLSTFITNATPFIEGIKQIDGTALTGVDTLASIILKLTGANLIEGITSLVAGENDMATFGSELSSFGTSLKEFSTSVTGINTEAITSAATAVESLSSMASSIPNMGGLVGFICGENSMATFGTELTSFGSGLKNFSSNVTGLDTESMTTAATAVESLTSMASSIPNMGGLVGFICGENSMATFGTELSSFGSGLKEFSTSVTGIDTEAVTAAATAATSLSTLANSIPESGGIFSWFTGDNTLDDFGDQLGKFGAGIASFSTSVAGVNSESMTSAITAVTNINTLANTMAETSNVNLLPGFGMSISSFGTDISDFYESISAIDANKIGAIASGLSTLASIDTTNADKLQSFINSLGKVGTDGVDSFVKSISDGAAKVAPAAAKLMQSAVKGVTSKKKLLTSAFKGAMNSAVNTINGYKSRFYSSGANIVAGVVSGIEDNKASAVEAARLMGEAMLAAFNAAWGIESPAKEAIKSSGFIVKGAVIGLDRGKVKVGKSAQELADYAKRGFTDAISKVGDLISYGIDDQPTIRPVLDLSDVSAGVSRIDSMFGINPSVGLMANVSGIGSMMSRRQNGANADVISAIKDLGNRIGESSGNNYYTVGDVTYDDGSNVANAIGVLVRAVTMEGRV